VAARPHNRIVWRAGNTNDGQSYARPCAVSVSDQTLFIEKQIDLTGLASAELRFDEWHDINDSAGDVGRVTVTRGSTSSELYSFGGSAASYAMGKGKGSGNLTAYVGATVKLRFELLIKGYSAVLCGGAPAGKKGLFIDNLSVVGN
jgi:hypothetical protein